MRNSMPFQWIEQAEARQVIVTALCEAPRPAALKPAGPWVDRIRGWVLARQSAPNQAPSGLPGDSAEPLDCRRGVDIAEPSGFYC